MDSQLTIPASHKVKIRILQITDTHLFAGKDQTLLGVNTWASYNAVLNTILEEVTDYDLVVATGDLVQDHSVTAYQHFADGIARLAAPCICLPGNHDFQPAMYTTLEKANLPGDKHVLLGEHWQAVLLDSQLSGAPHGMLSDYQISWLDATLSLYPKRHTLIFLHHHPLPSGCHWLDPHCLRNSHLLEEVLQHYPLAQTLLCGHIHQELELIWNGRRVLASPSTCVQFKPYSTSFTIDAVPPGWRELELFADGGVKTQVHRLQTQAFTPDFDAEGY